LLFFPISIQSILKVIGCMPATYLLQIGWTNLTILFIALSCTVKKPVDRQFRNPHVDHFDPPVDQNDPCVDQ